MEAATFIGLAQNKAIFSCPKTIKFGSDTYFNGSSEPSSRIPPKHTAIGKPLVI